MVAKGPVNMETTRLHGKKFILFKSLGVFEIMATMLLIIIFLFHVGLAIEDAVTGQLIYEKFNQK